MSLRPGHVERILLPAAQIAYVPWLRAASGGEFRRGESVEGLFKAHEGVFWVIYQVYKA